MSAKPENNHTAQLFRSTRAHLGKSVRVMATALKVPASKVNRIESGHLCPDKNTVDRLVQLSGAPDLETLFIMAFR